MASTGSARAKSWRSIATIAANDLRRRLRDRTFYLQGIGAPLAFAVIIGLAFGGGFTFKATIGVASADDSELSRQIVEGFTRQTDADAVVRFVAVDAGGVDGKLAADEIDAAIVLPEGFGSSITAPDVEPVNVVFDADKRITADVTASIARRLAAQLDASRLGIAAAIQAGGATDQARLQEIISKGQTIDIPIEVAMSDVTNRYSPVAYFGPSMGILFLFFTIGAGARSLITERREGTLQRVRSAPVSDATILLGKTGAVLLLGLASMLVLWVVTTFAFGAGWGDPLAVLGVIVGIVLATTGISILLTGLARTEAQAEGFTSVLAFVLALLGGNFLQPGSLPELLSKLSLATPNGWALRAFTQIGAAGATIGDVLPNIAVMVAIGVVCGLVGLRGVQAKVAA
jgi:ABC-2 type transport system permease protein